MTSVPPLATSGARVTRLPRRDPWEVKFRALTSFKARTGHCRVPTNYRANGVDLGRWVIDQRRAFALGRLSQPRVLRLQRLGLILDPRNAGWRAGIAALHEFKRRETHCNVPKSHCEGGLNLGEWLANIRKRWPRLPENKKRQLISLGVAVAPREDSWETYFEALRRFKARTGHCAVTRFHMEGDLRLGVWVNNLRSSRARLPRDRKLRLNAIGFIWTVRTRRGKHRGLLERGAPLPVS